MNADTNKTDDCYQRLLAGPGMRLARWGHSNHCEEWDEARDEAVLNRAKENVKQLPKFVEKLKAGILESNAG